MVSIELEEEERQATVLALAMLSLQRPGWDDLLNRIAVKMDNPKNSGRGEMYDYFRELHDDNEARVTAAAAAIANARGGRRGMPPIANVLEMLPQKLVDEVTEDARAAIDAYAKSVE